MFVKTGLWLHMKLIDSVQSWTVIFALDIYQQNFLISLFCDIMHSQQHICIQHVM